MICKDCKREFKKERKFFEIIKRRYVYLCDDCLNKNILNITHEVIPLDDGYNLYVIHLYDKLNIKIVDYLVYEYSAIIKSLFKKYNYILIENYFNLKKLPIYNILAKLINNNLYLICFN